MPNLAVVERDYGAIADKMTALGPNVEHLEPPSRGITLKPVKRWSSSGVSTASSSPASPRDALRLDEAKARLRNNLGAFSGTTNGRLAVAGWTQLGERTGADGPTRARQRGQAHHLRRHSSLGLNQSSRRRNGQAASTVGGATRPSPSTSRSSGHGTPSLGANTSSSTTTGWPNSASGSRRIGRHCR